MAFEIPKSSDYFYFGFNMQQDEGTADNNQFDPTIGKFEEWPAHITCSPPTIDDHSRDSSKLFQVIQEFCVSYPPVVATPVRDAYYGPDGSIPVKVFESSELNMLHYAIMGATITIPTQAEKLVYAFRKIQLLCRTSHCFGACEAIKSSRNAISSVLNYRTRLH